MRTSTYAYLSNRCSYAQMGEFSQYYLVTFQHPSSSARSLESVPYIIYIYIYRTSTRRIMCAQTLLRSSSPFIMNLLCVQGFIFSCAVQSCEQVVEQVLLVMDLASNSPSLNTPLCALSASHYGACLESYEGIPLSSRTYCL